jgi:hypothetical protein
MDPGGHADDAARSRAAAPAPPPFPDQPPGPRRFPGLGMLENRQPEPEPVVSQPMLRRLSGPEQAMVEAAELFNDTAYRRTIAGIAKSLGDARVSLLHLAGVNPEIVITIAWDISWYQYRVVFESAQAVRLAERGYELEELDARFKDWNAHLHADGRVVPDIPRV